MPLRQILGGSLVVLLLSGGAAVAQENGSRGLFGLPGVFGGEKAPADVQVAQAADPRITALEEQVRQLNGTIEELNFQILQMQEQMRKLQEDNEFRFQELEQKKSQADGKAPRVAATDPAAPQRDGDGGGAGAAAAGDPAPAEPPRTLGTITFDADGNMVGGGEAPPAAAGAGADQTKVAALPSTDDPAELYRNSYEFILSGDYATAEKGFRDYVARFPKGESVADAHYWLGESLLGQQKYRDAAEIFLAANKNYPSSKKAPDMLLKLGVSLAGLNQRDVACATYAEVEKRYPDASAQLKQRLKQERALAAC